MNNAEIERIAEAVSSHLEKKRSLDTETHRKHHEFIDHLIKEDKMRANRNEQWIRIVGGWGIIAVLSGVGIAIWQYLKHQLNG